MLKIFLCDDNQESVKTYAALLERVAAKHGILISITTMFSGEALLFHLCEAPAQADIIYLDILMDRTNGMETARRLRECGCRAEIVFLTSSEDYVYEAFDVNAVQYLLKDDTSTEKFEQVFLRAAKLAAQKEAEMFLCEFDNAKKMVPLHDISYFEIWKRVVTVHYGQQTAKFYDTMENLERRLAEKGFVRVHRSYLVHLPFIAQFQTQSLLLKTGESIPVGVTYMQQVKNAFSDYVSRSGIYGGRTTVKRP